MKIIDSRPKFALLALPGELLTLIVEMVLQEPCTTLTVYPNGELVPHALLRTCRSLRHDIFQPFLLTAPGRATKVVVLIDNFNFMAVKPTCLRLNDRLASAVYPPPRTPRFILRFHLSAEWKDTTTKHRIGQQLTKFGRELRTRGSRSAYLRASIYANSEVDLRAVHIVTQWARVLMESSPAGVKNAWKFRHQCVRPCIRAEADRAGHGQG